MMKKLFVLLLVTYAALQSAAQTPLDSIARVLSEAPVQEKVYLHLDNTCYYKGDTIWYKSYVVRADDLSYTDMSHILYVELVSPDGLVVERQNIIVSPDGYGDGNFELKDSLYSGYYEVRAYTRWMLNFCVTEHSNTLTDREQFYNRAMAKDFFRQYGTVYSRVVPVYERPDSTFDYLQKYVVSRPKSRLDKELKERLTVSFYPEGGHLIGGTRQTVAFEALSEEGEQLQVDGLLEVDGKTQRIATMHQGRGLFTVDVPERGTMKARFNYHGKDYTFDLPKIERSGIAVSLDGVGEELAVDVHIKGLPAPLGLAVLCRGVLRHFQTVSRSGRIVIDKDRLPTGVCDLIVIDESGQPLADRLFFVNHHDYDLQPVTVSGMKSSYQPFDSITLQFQAPVDAKHISISVRDGATDEPTYDTGNIMTDLLLSSDLKGFIAYPDYYFEADDALHRRHLDLLMMVQGWRRYDYRELTNGKKLRYQPEKNITVEGAVYPTIDTPDYKPEDIQGWTVGNFTTSEDDTGFFEGGLADTSAEQGQTDQGLLEAGGTAQGNAEQQTAQARASMRSVDTEYGVNHGGLKYEVTVEGELVLNDEDGSTDIATVEMQTTNGGRFMFNVPPYYGSAILFLTAYKTNATDKKLRRLKMRGRLDETAWPEFYVKRDLFFPVFARKYDYYQCHQPKDTTSAVVADDYQYVDTERLSKFDRQLQNVEVKTRRRRGRHAIDYTKPAYVYDTYDLYNLATDYGLSFGKIDFKRFPVQVSMLLLGNYNSERFFNVQARISDNLQSPYTFYRNFTPDTSVLNSNPFRTYTSVERNLYLNRQDKLRLFTDFELRNEDKPIEQASLVADVILDFVLMPDDSKRYTYRDRRIILHGMYEPDDFYHPDYGHSALPAADHRRTLYWNPNARLDADGRFTATFYNNGKPTSIRISTAGVFHN